MCQLKIRISLHLGLHLYAPINYTVAHISSYPQLTIYLILASGCATMCISKVKVHPKMWAHLPRMHGNTTLWSLWLP